MTNDEFTTAVRTLHANGLSCTEIARDHSLPLTAVRAACTPNTRRDTPLFIQPDLDALYGPAGDTAAAKPARHGGNTRRRRRA